MAEERKVRRGLPRKPGASEADGREAGEGKATADPAAGQGKPTGEGKPAGARPRRGLPRTPGAAPQPAEPKAEDAPPTAGSAPRPGTKATPGDADAGEPRRGPGRLRGLSNGQKAILALAGVIALAALVAVVAVVVRWFLDLGFMREFLADYPGEYHLPESAPVGFPGWLNWSHFLNAFLMILIVRTGLQVRHESRPPAFWAPKGKEDRKVSLTVWLHQSLDLLWLANGAIFLVLLFATGQWMRVVPTSWEVFPNALSVMLQYASLDWPTENGWVNYNGLQQLAYFATIFVAAPLATLTGLRLSGLWPKGAKTLNRAYPMSWARAVHFPVMLYFVAFIVVHVVLVFSTGVLRNLNHMFAASGSTDPGQYSGDWTGLLLFSVAVAVTVAALVAIAKPLVIAPIASRFGKVTSR